MGTLVHICDHHFKQWNSYGHYTYRDLTHVLHIAKQLNINFFEI